MFGDPSFGIGLGIKLAELTRWVVWPRYLDAPIARVNDRHYHWETRSFRRRSFIGDARLTEHLPSIVSKRVNVRYWHKADISWLSSNVRFRGQSGNDAVL
jgi:hypothetical protein